MKKRSNTEEKQNKPCNGKPFVKGDPRINRKGRPKSFDDLRQLAKDLLNQEVWNKDKTQSMTLVELIITKMANDPRNMEKVLEIAYGKVPNITEIHTNDEPVEMKITIIEDNDEKFFSLHPELKESK